MKDIAIFGAGGFGREVAALIHRRNEVKPEWNIIGFLDDGVPLGTIRDSYPVIGGLEYVNQYKSDLNVVIAMGNVKNLKKIAESIINPRICFPNIIDITTTIDPSVKMGKGNIIAFSNYLFTNVKIGNFNIFNTRCGVGHDTQVGSYNVFNPNVQLSGCVNVGNENFWGLNASVVQGIKVGDRNVIGACSLILKSIEDDSFYLGIPAKKRE